ncbi:MAG: DUF2764 domain-containing protein [Tannerella sp.]|jgi:hypothetical protein|nr:DUF2764 domain-containing protein [Tannerella sp.]
MGRYHYLITGLPELFFDGAGPPFTPMEFRELSAEYLTKEDAYLLDVLILEIDNKNLIGQMQHHDYDLLEGGKFTYEEMDVLISGVQAEFADTSSIQQEEDNEPFDSNNRFKNRNKRLPAYFESFVRMYMKSVVRKEEIAMMWEDRLSAMYYDYAMQTANDFITAWFSLNLNIKNVFSALTCRKYRLDRAKYIVGNNEVAEKLRMSDAPDFELNEAPDETLYELWPVLCSLCDEPDIFRRQMETDLIRWKWLDEQTFFNEFDIESIMAYWLKLEILEYWSELDREKGEEAFGQIIESMQLSSHHALEEFVLITATGKDY